MAVLLVGKYAGQPNVGGQNGGRPGSGQRVSEKSSLFSTKYFNIPASFSHNFVPSFGYYSCFHNPSLSTLASCHCLIVLTPSCVRDIKSAS